MGLGFLRKAEDALADDVALNLARPTRDARAGRGQQAGGFRSCEQGVGAGGLDPGRGGVEHQLGGPELRDRREYGCHRALAFAHHLERRAAYPQIGDALSAERVERSALGEHGVESTLECDPSRADVAAFVRQRGHRHRPAHPGRSEQCVRREFDVVEKDFVELGAAVHLSEWPHLHAGGAGVDEEERDPAMRSGAGNSARQQDRSVGNTAVRTPHLLSVHDPAVAVGFGACGQ